MFNLMPFKSTANDVFDYFDNFEKKFFGDMDREFSNFRTDITDEGDHYLLKADLPGFKKEDIQIDLKNNMLTIKAEKNEETEDKGKNYIRRERRIGSYQRSFDVSDIHTNQIEAAYESGVLELRLPKLQIAETEVQKIEVK